MTIAEAIKAAREARGMTQEDLAEKLEVSRQAVSKWEVGASVPTPENLEILSQILEVSFETEESAAPSALPQSRTACRWKIAALALGGLMLAALLSIGMYLLLHPTEPKEPSITGIWFFDEDGTPLDPDLGDGWKSFTVGQRVYLLVSFRNGTEIGVVGVSLFATPTGTETYDERKQLAIQAVRDRPFALFPLDFPAETMVHLDVTLECGGGQNITETLNVTAVPFDEIGCQIYEFDCFMETLVDGSVVGKTLVDFCILPVSE